MFRRYYVLILYFRTGILTQEINRSPTHRVLVRALVIQCRPPDHLTESSSIAAANVYVVPYALGHGSSLYEYQMPIKIWSRLALTNIWSRQMSEDFVVVQTRKRTHQKWSSSDLLQGKMGILEVDFHLTFVRFLFDLHHQTLALRYPLVCRGRGLSPWARYLVAIV